MEDGNPRLVVCAAIGAANGVAAMAAALAVSASRGRAGRAESGVALIDLRSSARPLRGAVLASSRARSIESLCREHPGLRPAARGRVCFLTAAGEPSGPERAELLSDLLSPGLGVGLVVAVCDPPDFRGLIAIRDQRAALGPAEGDAGLRPPADRAAGGRAPSRGHPGEGLGPGDRAGRRSPGSRRPRSGRRDGSPGGPPRLLVARDSRRPPAAGRGRCGCGRRAPRRYRRSSGSRSWSSRSP